MFLRGLKDSARVIVSDKTKIGYVHVWSYASRRIQSALEDLMAEGPLKDADALVFDLRGGWGGAQPQYLDLFNPRAPTMQVKDRNGETGFVDVKWRKPVAMLINEGTRSGKEVLAYGFKEYRLGELIGHRTEGAVLRGHGVPDRRRRPASARGRGRAGRRPTPRGVGVDADDRSRRSISRYAAAATRSSTAPCRCSARS